MGTRLLSEYLIKKYHPQLRYVRVHTSGKNKATLYAWNDELTLPEPERLALKTFAAGYLPSYVCYQIKEYSMVQVDQIPPMYELPDCIVQTAMSRDLDPLGVVAAITSMLSDGELVFDRYDMHTGTLHFEVRTSNRITDIEKELMVRYLYEIIPIGSTFKVTYCELAPP